MNLWNVFPDHLLIYDYFIELLFILIALYFYLFYTTFKISSERFYLISFLLLSFCTSIIIINNISPRVGPILIPLILLSAILMPLIRLIQKIIKRDFNALHIWVIAIIAGFILSSTWSAIFFIAART